MRDNRGLLVVHGTGTGKTLTASTISQCYLDDNPTNKVVFIGPASLEANFRKELRNYGVSNTDIAKSYKFYSFQKFLGDTKRRTLNRVLDDKDREKIGWPLNPINLKNSLLIVDEAHNVRNTKTSTARAIQSSAFTADKVLLLTATPFVNNMQDYIPLINMIYGRYVVGTYKEFKERRVPDYLSKNSVPSKEDLQTFRALLRDKVDVVNKKDQKYFPKRKDHMKYVKMTPAYLNSYTKLMGSQNVAGLFFKNPERFYNGYRRAVNMAGPQYFSSKVKKAIPYLKKGKALIYSNWLNFGVIPISQALKKAGISFEKYTGKTPKIKREKIIDDFNNEKFQVLIVSSAGGEGLDLKGVRSVVVLDPPWNDASLEQVIGRAVRYKSHSHLPKKDRVVNVYLMALVDPHINLQKLRKDTEDKYIPEDNVVSSGDILLYDIIKKKSKAESVLLKELQKMSITR
jgi:SNF2 family DNA or RNA helicase